MKVLYKDIRSNIKSGDLIAWSQRKWDSLHNIEMQLIRIITRSEYVHVGTTWVVGERIFVIDAVMPKVRIFPLSNLLPFYLIPLNSPWKKETEDFAIAQVGKDYSLLQAIQSVLKKPNLDDNWQCAELVHEIMKSDGIDLGEIYTPSELVNNALNYSSGLRFISE